MNVYSVALLQGSRLAPNERERIASQLARYTGLSKEYVLRLRPVGRNRSGISRNCCGTGVRRWGGWTRASSATTATTRASIPESDPMLANLIGAYAAGIKPVLPRHAQGMRPTRRTSLHAPIWDKWNVEGFRQQVRQRRRQPAARDAGHIRTCACTWRAAITTSARRTPPATTHSPYLWAAPAHAE
jgi:hypothetical protein